jgi:hypothetical protein
MLKPEVAQKERTTSNKPHNAAIGRIPMNLKMEAATVAPMNPKHPVIANSTMKIPGADIMSYKLLRYVDSSRGLLF